MNTLALSVPVPVDGHSYYCINKIKFTRSLPLLALILVTWFQFCEGKGGWLKFCEAGVDISSKFSSSFLIHAGGCAKGALLEKPVKVSCVCVNGVWTIANSDCDPAPYVLVGKGDCFQLEGAMLSSFKFIGRPSTPFSPGTFMGSTYLDGFWKINSGFTSANVSHLESVSFISINVHKAVSAKNVACCPPPNELSKDLPVHICLQAPKGDYSLRSKCQSSLRQLPVLSQVSLDYGQGIQIDTRKNETIRISATTDCGACAAKRRITYETDCCKALPFEDDAEFAHIDAQRYEKQTNRMAVNHLELILRKKKSVILATSEFTHLRYASYILGKVCPSKEVPKDLLKTILRFFKQAVNESVEEFPMERTVDQVQHDRILKTLQTCAEKAGTEWQVVYTPGTCNKEIDKMVTSTGEVNCDIPEFQKYDTERYDLITETVWKIVQFVHYFCSVHFEEFPTDSAYLLTGLERLFNADIVRRWTHPGKTYDVLQFLLPTQNLEKFSKTIDACVGTAKFISTHKHWIVRPSSRYLSVKNKNSGPIWNNSGVCLMSYWYPPWQTGVQDCHR